MSDFKTTIGLEIHCQLKTKSKMFCGCDNDAEDKEPNTLVCPVCLAMPGTLPVTNRAAVEMTVMTGLALGCEIPKESKFDRKHYFYPDLPKGFQISQYDQPLCKGGEVEVDGKIIRLNRIHLEEDAGKLIHPSHGRAETGQAGKDYSLVDLNRAGTPLMEIVTEPDIISPAEARKFMEELQMTLRYLGVSDADMEKGHLRCDANISISYKSKVTCLASRFVESKRVGEPRRKSKKLLMSPIVEIKNLNSFKFVEQALAFEAKRLSDDFENWPEKRTKITRGFDSKRGVTFEQRRKEEAADYRYFPEPDIPPISFSDAEIENLRSKISELPKQRHQRYIDAGIRNDVAEKLIRQPQLAEYLETSNELKHDLAIFISEEVSRAIAENNLSFDEYQNRVPVTRIADLLNLVGEGIISKTVAKEIFTEMIMTGEAPSDIIRNKGLEQVSDGKELESQVNKIIKENPDLVEKYRTGKIQVIGFFVGKIMQATGGKANPQVLNKLLIEKLNGHSS